MKKLFKNSSGMTLALVIIIFSVVAIIGTILLTLSLSQVTSAAASEDMTAAYYYARSAVDIVSTDIQKKQQDLINAENTLLQVLNGAGTQAVKNAAIATYNTKMAEFDALKLIPAATSETCTVQVSNILSQPLTVNISLLASGKIQLSCEAAYDSFSSSAKAQIGQFVKQQKTVTYSAPTPIDTTWLGDDALYSWGNVLLDSGNFTMQSATSSQGTISAQGTIAEGNGFTEKSVPEAPKTENVPHDIPILVAPALSDKRGVSLAGTRVLTPDNSGYYGMFDETIRWTVNTTADKDVILVFNSFTTDGNCLINVTGPGNLYIYVKESYTIPGAPNPNPQTAQSSFTSRTLIDISNHTTIQSNGSYTNPKTYFIAYNDVLQWYHDLYHLNATLMPAAETSQILKSDKFDAVTVDNLNNISAYFYLPGCSYSNTNNGDLYGSVYASSIYVKNNKNIIYYPFTDASLFDNAGAVVSGTSTTTSQVTYNEITPPGTRIWVR